MKSTLDTHWRVVDVVLICEQRRVVLGPHFLNFGSHSRPEFERIGIIGCKVKLSISKYEVNFGYPFEGCRNGLDLRLETCSSWAAFSQLRVTFQARV
jgi:hypothetical protein